MTIPVCAFITFQTDDGHAAAMLFGKSGWINQRMAKSDDDDAHNILGRKVEFL
jgi:hypothetical protein